MLDVVNSLTSFIESFVALNQVKNESAPRAEYDEEWPSPCIVEVINAQECTWQPIRNTDDVNFENVESALELKLNSDIKQFFTTFYTDAIDAECDEGKLTLLFPWSKQDFERLQENLIGHVMMKRQLKQPITLFFAVTDDDENFLSINNDDGTVWVERVGCLPHKKVAESLSEFVAGLKPII